MARVRGPIKILSETWLDATRLPGERATAALGCIVVVGALTLARYGTTHSRLAAGAVLLLALAALVFSRRRSAKQWRDSAWVVRHVAGGVDSEKAERALRALSLVDEKGQAISAGTSSELARAHVQRSLNALPFDRITAAARRQGTRLGSAAIVFALVALALFVLNPWAVFEGGDILFARHGIAPLAMRWIGDTQLDARPPGYLHQEAHEESPYNALSAPRGTLLTFRGVATHSSRRLALTDGESEVPFVDDGNGRVVARWPLADSVDLKIVARFGDVVIEEPEGTAVTSIADEAPVVTLEGAPRQVVLAPPGGGDDVSEIPIRYEASDDHGLREVHLVLRSAGKEERRVLAHPDSDTRSDRGGYVLRAGDPFVKRSHAAIEVSVEAKDNDPITGPKWGKSEVITLVPPEVGEPNARRIDALKKLRDQLVETLAWRIGHDIPGKAPDRKSYFDEEKKRAQSDADTVEVTLTSSYAGLKISGRLQAMVRGKMLKLRSALDKEIVNASAPARADVLKGTERIVLVVDAIIQGLDVSGTRETAKELADVADDLAVSTTEMQKPIELPHGNARADAAVTVLAGGARSLMRYGTEGRDIGEIVTVDLLRVARARTATDYPHADLAARDLAARLHQPDPSFGSQGKSGRAGGESGGGRGTPGDSASEGGDDVDQAANEAAKSLERLAEDHAGNMGSMEQALSGAASADELKALTEEAKKHAEAVREATRSLPSIGGGSDSWTSKGSAAREHADQMAHSLEQGNPADAVTSGRSALQALDEAKRVAQSEHWSMFSHDGPDKKLDDARQKLEPEVKWAEDKLAELRKKAAERAAGDLSKGGQEEDKLADRAHEIGEKGREQGDLPAPALDALEAAEKAAREAARALQRGEGDKGLERQQDAQRKLEMAKQALGQDDGDDDPHGEDGDGHSMSTTDHADIPKADAHKGPEEFRRRVIQGLGQPSGGKERDAIRRYAEGLLR
ncbi:MAG: DUF4175 domain-containing protein [Polyangiaceae bacterium]